MGFTYQAEQWLPYPAEAVFAFFANPENLPALMPKWQNARIDEISIVPPMEAGGKTTMASVGSRVTLSFRPFPGSPFRLRWVAEITEFVLNSHFTDEQVKGPFVFWTHSHRIRNVDRAGINITIVVDQVEYEPRMGFLGRLANALLRKQLDSTFTYRQAVAADLIGKQLRPVISIPQQQKPRSPQSGKRTA